MSEYTFKPGDKAAEQNAANSGQMSARQKENADFLARQIAEREAAQKKLEETKPASKLDAFRQETGAKPTPELGPLAKAKLKAAAGN